MDVEAVSHGTGDVLEALRLVKTGDRISLWAFRKRNHVTEEAEENKGKRKEVFWKLSSAKRKKRVQISKVCSLPHS